MFKCFMNQIYATYKHTYFLFNVQPAPRYKWMVFHDKPVLHVLAAVLMSLTLKTVVSQIKECVLP